MKPTLVTVAFVIIATLVWGSITNDYLTRSGYETSLEVKFAVYALVAIGASIVAFPLRKLL